MIGRLLAAALLVALGGALIGVSLAALAIAATGDGDAALFALPRP